MEEITFDRLQHLKTIRESFELSVREAAESIGISFSHLFRIENGEKLPSKHVLENINNFYQYMENTYVKKDLAVSYDYFRVTFKSSNVEKILKEVFWIDFSQLMYSERTPLFGYEEMAYFGGMFICWSNEGSRAGTCIEMRGVGTSLFTHLLEEQKRTWEDIFEELQKYDCNIGRIDIAIDDFKGYLDLPSLRRKVDRQEYDSRFDLVWAIHGNRKRQDKEYGSTIYCGSPKSNMHFCFYQKNIELAEKLKKEVWEIDIINRYEIRLKDDYANGFVARLLKREMTLGEMAMALIRERITFLTSKRDGSGDLGSWKAWENFVGRGHGLKLSPERLKRTYEQTMMWLVNQTFPSLKAIREIEDTLGIDRLDELYDQIELNDEKKRFVEESCRRLKDLILEKEGD